MDAKQIWGISPYLPVKLHVASTTIDWFSEPPDQWDHNFLSGELEKLEHIADENQLAFDDVWVSIVRDIIKELKLGNYSLAESICRTGFSKRTAIKALILGLCERNQVVDKWTGRWLSPIKQAGDLDLVLSLSQNYMIVVGSSLLGYRGGTKVVSGPSVRLHEFEIGLNATTTMASLAEFNPIRSEVFELAYVTLDPNSDLHTKFMLIHAPVSQTKIVFPGEEFFPKYLGDPVGSTIYQALLDND